MDDHVKKLMKALSDVIEVYWQEDQGTRDLRNEIQIAEGVLQDIRDELNQNKNTKLTDFME